MERGSPSRRQEPMDEVFCSRKTFFVYPYHLSHQSENNTNATSVTGQMYVESLKPKTIKYSNPIILIHGDYHTGQIWVTKPDENPGWASFFVQKGYHVYVVDLPATGRSGTMEDEIKCDSKTHTITPQAVERNLTAHGVQPGEPAWLTAPRHCQWPGTGIRGDRTFDQYYASLVPLRYNNIQRQQLAQVALKELLLIVGKSILIGEGSGATMAFLAGDARPDLVATIVSLEPAGPPCGVAFENDNGKRRFTGFVKKDTNIRPYGLTDIPITYDPPISPQDGPEYTCKSPLDVDVSPFAHLIGSAILQQPPSASSYAPLDLFVDTTPSTEVRQLVNLRKFPHLLVTSHTSSHATFDFATYAFMCQAGIDVNFLSLEANGISGNGHLMFLELNSDEIANLIHDWLWKRMKNKAVQTRTRGEKRKAPSSDVNEEGMENTLIDLQEEPDLPLRRRRGNKLVSTLGERNSKLISETHVEMPKKRAEASSRKKPSIKTFKKNELIDLTDSPRATPDRHLNLGEASSNYSELNQMLTMAKPSVQFAPEPGSSDLGRGGISFPSENWTDYFLQQGMPSSSTFTDTSSHLDYGDIRMTKSTEATNLLNHTSKIATFDSGIEPTLLLRQPLSLGGEVYRNWTPPAGLSMAVNTEFTPTSDFFDFKCDLDLFKPKETINPSDLRDESPMTSLLRGVDEPMAESNHSPGAFRITTPHLGSIFNPTEWNDSINFYEGQQTILPSQLFSCGQMVPN